MGEFDDFLAELREVQEFSKNILKVIPKVERIRERIEKIYLKLREALTTLEADKDMAASQDAIMEARDSANNILTDEMLKAVALNSEFNDPLFVDKLMVATMTPGVVDLIPEGKTLFVDIKLDEVAGTLEDYAQGIEKVRSELAANASPGFKHGNGKKPVTPANMASYFWQEKLYLPARAGQPVTRRKYNQKTKEYENVDVAEEQIRKYWDTMKKRIQYSGKLAPFWEIIDKGTVAFEAVTQGAGTEFPTNAETDFTGKTVTRLQKLYKETYNDSIEIIERDISDLRNRILELGTVLDEANSIIEKLEETNIDIAELLFEQLGERLEYADREKVDKLIEDLRAGRWESIRTTSEDRIELTGPKGRREGKRVRISMGQLRSASITLGLINE